MARFRPLRWLARVFRPEPPTPPPARPRAARPRPTPRAPVRGPEPRRDKVARFYTREAPTELTGSYEVSSLVGEAYFNPDLSADDRMELRQALHDYVESEYDIRFEDYFDWEAWREEMGY